MGCFLRVASISLALTAAGCSGSGTPPASGTDHGGAAALNMRLLAHDDLQGRPTYQVVVHQQGDRWYLYIGHHGGKALNPLTGEDEINGTSIVDVTDPTHPIYVSHTPPSRVDWYTGPKDAAEGAQHAQVCSGDELPHGKRGHTYVLRTVGRVAQEIIDVTDPRNVVVASEIARAEVGGWNRQTQFGDFTSSLGTSGTHKNFWDCATGIGYLPTSVAGWSTLMVLRAFDLSDPHAPRHIRDFDLPGTQPGGKGSMEGGLGVHEVVGYGDRLYVAYGAFDHGVVQILDRDKFLHGDPSVANPLEPTDASLRYPQIGILAMPEFWGAHTAKPILGVHVPDYRNDTRGAVRDFMFVVSEGVNWHCTKVRDPVFFVDITDAQHPFPISTFQVPAITDPPGNGTGDFCGDRLFGPHATQASFSDIYLKKILFLSYFSAGVRAVDIRDPFHPREVGYFIPQPNANTHFEWYGNKSDKFAVTNNVEVDPRGRYIYIVDRAGTGVHVLELTGEAAAIVAAPTPQ